MNWMYTATALWISNFIKIVCFFLGRECAGRRTEWILVPHFEYSVSWKCCEFWGWECTDRMNWMDHSTALWISNLMKILCFLGLRMRRQDELDGSLYRTLDIKFHENVMFFRSRVRRQDELNGSLYRTLNVQIYEENLTFFWVASAQAWWTGWILIPHFGYQLAWLLYF